MKKTILIAVILVAALSLGAVGYAFAQSQYPQGADATCPYGGTGMMGGGYGRGMMGNGAGRGMMGAQGACGAANGGQGLLQGYVLSGFASAFGMTTEDLQARLDAGDTMWVVAQEKGYTTETFTELMTQVRSDAFAQGVADGVITQAQADWMQQRMNQKLENGFTPGACTQNGGMMGRGMRWNQQP